VIARAQLADALCKASGRDISIFPGLRRPLLIESRQPEVPQASALANWPHRREFPEHEAIEFMRRTIRQHPGQVTLLGIGPLTNIAALFEIDPQIPQLLKQLVLMGGNMTPIRWGSLSSGLVEWNIWNDPYAAAVVFAAHVRHCQIIGLDVTRQVELDVATARERFRGGALNLVAELAEVWFGVGKTKVTFHDPLAAVSIFDPEVCTYQRGTIAVELVSKQLEGFTFYRPDPAGAHHVATAVKVDRFFEDYFAVVSKQ